MNIVITINGKKRFVQDRITVFEACRQSGVYVPHFCYHPKMSIPANCRMCLVQIEKVPKPVPACATYVTDGMVIRTLSEAAQNAQKGVMEFLLINHPLDCPICDQGGECQLQDLSVGFGMGASRYAESKRVVVEKHLGPLISTVMTRCIHCTRCVRFGQEVANNMELGMAGRGEHSEIMPFIKGTVDSEISGNMIDVCPVGALNSKPFRFTARTWEMDRADGVSQHDSYGSYLRVQSIDGEVKRVLPRDHEEINECWLSDRDRFAYAGVNSESRLLYPMVRDVGSVKPQRVEWTEALERTRSGLREVIDKHGAGQVGFLLGPSSVSEVGMLVADFARGIGSNNVDHRLRMRDFSLDGHIGGAAWLGSSLEQLEGLERLLLVGSNPSRELPLLPVRLRRLQKRKLRIHSISARSVESQLRLETEAVVPPSAWLAELAKVASAAAGDRAPDWLADFGKPDERHAAVAESLKEGKAAVVLGQQAVCHGRYGALRAVASVVAEAVGGFHGVLVVGANSVGNTLAGAVPHHGFMLGEVPEKGLNAREMVEAGLKAYVLVDCEPADFADQAAALSAFRSAFTVHVGGYGDVAREYSDVMLPGSVFAERTGATVNLEGNAATMYSAFDPPGEARPAWKVFRVLGKEMGVEGFDYDTLEHIRARLIAAGDFTKKLSNSLAGLHSLPAGDDGAAADGELERLPEVSHFDVDQITRRSEPLRQTRISALARTARMHPGDMERLGIEPGGTVAVSANGATVECPAEADSALAKGCVRCPMAVDEFAQLGAAASVTVAAAAEGKRSAAAGG